MTTGRLRGKTILLTGAAGGQGRVALKLLSREGARLIATDASPDGAASLELCKSEGADAHYVSADLATSAGRAKVLKYCRANGPIDVLYSNHGVIVGRDFLKTTKVDWRRIQAVNVESVFFLIQGAVPMMSSGSSIIIVASTAGLRAQPNMSAYSAAKGALIMLTRSLALDLSRYGIRVNAIAPGLIDTAMPRTFIAAFERPNEVWQQLISTNILRRAGRPEEVVNLAIHLASDESSFTTGSIVVVDGGRTAM